MSRGTSRRRLACVLYHEILRPGARTYFGVSESQFTTHLDRLRGLGLTASSLEAALTSPVPAVAITFDDGHASHYSVAFPELRRRGMTATFFVTTDWVGEPGRVTWEQLREMVAAGMSVQSHTVSHPFLSELSTEQVRKELVESKRELDERLNQLTTTIALPGGDFPRGWRVRDFVACGYRQVASSRWGSNYLHEPALSVPLVLRRYTVRRSTSVRRFDQLVIGASLAFGLEGARVMILNRLRAILGAHRYAAWREHFLRSYRL